MLFITHKYTPALLIRVMSKRLPYIDKLKYIYKKFNKHIFEKSSLAIKNSRHFNQDDSKITMHCRILNAFLKVFLFLLVGWLVGWLVFFNAMFYVQLEKRYV